MLTWVAPFPEGVIASEMFNQSLRFALLIIKMLEDQSLKC